ncbi:MAG: Brp/Blh family beta-carotene 15,15'-dioxygenase [Candidatus Methylopumilus sp.]|nr:Brp/Blh family beta-carotene 15,15'-dioxygenase [Candidatus Methylopumilus sp.]
MLNKVRIHQLFYLILSLFLIFITQRNTFFKITDVDPSIAVIFLIIMSFGVSHGAADSIIIWKTFTKIKIKAIAFLIYLLIVFLGLLLWFQSPILGLIILLLMSIIHFGQSDLSYLSKASQSMKISWGFVMTLLPVIFFENDVKLIFDTLVNFNLNVAVFSSLRLITFGFIGSFLFFVGITKGITKKDKFFLVLEFLTTIMMASFLNPLYWFTFYFCFLHGLRALINIGIKSLRDFLFLIIFTLPVTFFSYFILFESLQIKYLSIIFSVLMALTISHMLLPSINRSLLKTFD